MQNHHETAEVLRLIKIIELRGVKIVLKSENFQSCFLETKSS